jgi:hypothetical protein
MVRKVDGKAHPALKAPLDAVTLGLSQLDWNGVSVGAASLVLQDFLAGKIG